MLTSELPPNGEKTSIRYPKTYFFLIVITTFFIFMYSSSFDWKWNSLLPQKWVVFKNPPPAKLSLVERGFLVYSENCHIPDIDPWHVTVKHIIEKSAPLDCSIEYPALTIREGKVLRILPEVAAKRSIFNFTCCYRGIYRDQEGSSDNRVRISDDCHPINSTAKISEEFIKVECHLQNGTEFYKNFHSFLQVKQQVEDRCSKSGDDAKKYSVLVVGVDAMSRLNMHRQLNRTASFLFDKLHALEMYGFNKVGSNTFPNLVAMLMGYDERELSRVCWESDNLPLDKCDFIWKHFAKNGYRTFYAEDTPHISSFNYVKKGFFYQPTDYYLRPYILAYEDALGRNKPLNCYLCVGPTSETEAILDWTQQFVATFHNSPFFAFIWINSLTHDFLNMGSSGDHMYESFFKNLYEKKHLDNTIVIMMGDHGMRWGPIMNTHLGHLERRLPMLLIAVPPRFRQQYPKLMEMLKINAHRLITPFDLHATLDNILHLNETWEGIDISGVNSDFVKNFTGRSFSLFHPIPENRSCTDAFIDEHWCTCKMSVPVDPKSNNVKSVAGFLVNYLNSLLKPHSDICSFLRLANITDSRTWTDPASDKSYISTDEHVYTVTIQTKPGNAVFEGTVRLMHNKSNYDLLGGISRLNLYGNQSACVKDALLRKYCYCT